MNHPVKIKKVFTRIRYQAHDFFQNLRDLKRSINCLVRNIDDMNACVSRSRQLVQGLSVPDGKTVGGEERLHGYHRFWTSCAGGEP